MQYAQDYFATRHLLAACLCAVLLVIIDARWFRYHSGVWYLSSRCTHMCAVVCGRPRASTTSASRAELFSNLFSRTREYRTNVSQDKFVWPNNFVSQKSVCQLELWPAPMLYSLHLDLAFLVSSLVQFQGNWKWFPPRSLRFSEIPVEKLNVQRSMQKLISRVNYIINFIELLRVSFHDEAILIIIRSSVVVYCAQLHRYELYSSRIGISVISFYSHFCKENSCRVAKNISR